MDQPKIERLLRLMKLLTGNVNYTVEQLAEKLDTSYRSIYRYIDTFKEAGFVVHKLEGGVYKLGKESRHFKDISQLIHFTDEEAHIFNQLIDALDDSNALKHNLRRKLSSVYDCTSLANSTVRGKNATNINTLIEAIGNQQQVILHDYSSSNTGIVSDRVVEPFSFTTNYVQIWCYEPVSRINKLFNTSRIGSVEVTEQSWQHTDEHNAGYIDIFRTRSFERTQVTMRLTLRAYNLLTEEYPLAERDLSREDENHWILRTEVCSMAGIGRFVLGLWEDVEIIDSPELSDYLSKKIEKMYNKIPL
ncbi:MAG: WYL domain-containing protein [Tidjanibacter sp.]|nr:WYL domain-containing protein [Tidjanibacter sp.]